MAEPLVSSTRLRALRSALGTGDQPLLIVIHDYPDPDAIAAAMGMQTLVGSWGVSSVIAHGGIIGREENTEMVRLLKIELKGFDALTDLSEYRGALFLDTQPMARNQSLPPHVPVLGVIDHHNLGEDSVRLSPKGATGTGRILYSDIRSDVGASSTLVLGYLETAGITPDARLATALFLGIKTDTDGLLRDANPADIDAYTRLLPLSDLKKAALSLHPPLTREYFRFLHIAVSKARVFGNSLIAECGDVRSPDLLSTASDILVGTKGVFYALAVGFHNGRAYLSLRAKPPRNDATRVLLHVVEPEGKGGGHSLSAGGFMDAGGSPEKCLELIRSRLLEAVGDEGGSGMELI